MLVAAVVGAWLQIGAWLQVVVVVAAVGVAVAVAVAVAQGHNMPLQVCIRRERSTDPDTVLLPAHSSHMDTMAGSLKIRRIDQEQRAP